MAAQGDEECSVRDVPILCNSADWEQDGKHCSICRKKIGKHVLHPRHHCRICGRCVCASCSPSSVNLEGKQHRACNLCTNKLEKATRFQRALVLIGDSLYSLAGSGAEVTATSSNGASSSADHADQSTFQCSTPTTPPPSNLGDTSGIMCSPSASHTTASHTMCSPTGSERLPSNHGAQFLSEVSTQAPSPGGTRSPPADAVLYCTAAVEKVRAKLAAIEARATTAEAAVQHKSPPPNLEPCAKWEPNIAECRICFGQFCVRRWTHHCRLCGRCVCGDCSPHRVELPDQRGLQRACRDCVVRNPLPDEDPLFATDQSPHAAWRI